MLDARQIDLQLMPSITKHRSIFKHWEFLSRQIRTPQGGFFNAFTTDEPGRAEGHPAAPEGPLLIIADEAKSIPPEIFDAIDRCSFNTLDVTWTHLCSNSAEKIFHHFAASAEVIQRGGESPQCRAC